MDTIWWVLGAVVLVATLLDIVLAALNYDDAGFLAGPFSRGLWRVLRSVTRRLPRTRRPWALRQVTGVQVIGIVLLWIFGVSTGYGLVYYGLMTRDAFSDANGGSPSLFDALYFSAAQLATVGGSNLTAETDLLRFLSIAESLTGVVLISLILTFLLGVYDVIGDLNALCTRFVSAERGAGSPVATLRPYLRNGEVDGLDGHLDAVADAFASYTGGVRLHHAAYYFQSGRDRFALPYALRMIGGTVAALRWGVPSGHPASTLPTLQTLQFQYLEFGRYLTDTISEPVDIPLPRLVDAATFARLVRDRVEDAEHDRWVARFVRMEQQIAPMVGSDPLADLDDAYARYTRWLPLAHRTEEITLGVGRDLDYQPVIVADAPVALLGDPGDVARENVAGYLRDPAPTVPAAGPGARTRRRVRGRESLLDPGYARLRAGARAVAAAVAAALCAYALALAVGEDDSLRPVIFAGFVGMLASRVVAERTPGARRGSALTFLLTVLLVVVLASWAAPSHVWTGLLAVAVAAAGAWAGRFGPQAARLGTVTFMACYFALLMRIDTADVAQYLVGALLGVGSGYLLAARVLPERPDRVLHAGLTGFRRELLEALGVLEDATSWGRWDGSLARRMVVAQRRLTRGSAFVAGRLTGPPEATAVDARRSGELRLHLFSVNLGEANLVTAVRRLTDVPVSLELRGRLAGRLELLRAHLERTIEGDAPPGRRHREHPPESWPAEALAVHRATDELESALTALERAERADVPADDGAAQADEAHDDTVRELPPPVTPPPPSGRFAPPTRRAVQAALAVGAGLLLGEVVSAPHQYWAMLASYQVLGASDAETFRKAGQRVLGTVAGALVGFGVAIATGGDPTVMLPLLVAGVFGSTYFRPVSTAAQTFFTMMIFAVVYESLGRLTTVTVEVRILETLLGAVIALVVAAVVLPTRSRVLLDRDLVRLVGDLRVVLDSVLARLAGSATVPTSALDARLLVIDDDVRRVGETAAPLRRSGGVLDAGSVEQRLAAVWSVTYDVRYLVHALERGVDRAHDPQGTDWEALRAVTADNMAALLAVLEHRAVPAVHPVPARDGTTPPGEQRALLHRVDRINQALVLLIGQLAPDAVDSVDDDGVPVAPEAVRHGRRGST